MTNSKKTDLLYLIDGSGYIFRAFYALPPLTRKSEGDQRRLFQAKRMRANQIKKKHEITQTTPAMIVSIEEGGDMY